MKREESRRWLQKKRDKSSGRKTQRTVKVKHRQMTMLRMPSPPQGTRQALASNQGLHQALPVPKRATVRAPPISPRRQGTNLPPSGPRGPGPPPLHRSNFVRGAFARRLACRSSTMTMLTLPDPAWSSDPPSSHLSSRGAEPGSLLSKLCPCPVPQSPRLPDPHVR